MLDVMKVHVSRCLCCVLNSHLIRLHRKSRIIGLVPRLYLDRRKRVSSNVKLS